MTRREYNKLIRDNIPAIIAGNGGTCQVTPLADAEFMLALRQKLVEEAQEVAAATDDSELLKELADVYTVLDTLLRASDLTWDAVQAQVQQRLDERGGFEQKLRLDWVET